MKRIFTKSIIIIFGVLIGLSNIFAQIDEEKLVETKLNSKYQLSAKFFEFTNSQTTILKLINTKNDKELGFVKINGENSSEVWSPDFEYLIVGDELNIRIYKTSLFTKLVNTFDSLNKNFFTKQKTFDEISILTPQKNSGFRHKFLGWHNRSSFDFSISYFDWNELAKNDSIACFRYDVVSRILSRKTRSSKEMTESEKIIYRKTLSLIGENKFTIIKNSQIKKF